MKEADADETMGDSAARSEEIWATFLGGAGSIARRGAQLGRDAQDGAGALSTRGTVGRLQRRGISCAARALVAALFSRRCMLRYTMRILHFILTGQRFGCWFASRAEQNNLRAVLHVILFLAFI